MKGISIVICCYNSENKIASSLQFLSKQKKLADAPFELVLVDNNCTDKTIELALNTWNTLGNVYPLRVVVEKKAGLNFARKAGIESALHPYVVLCDDDNWLCEDYLFKIYNIFETMPRVAIAGGVGQAVSDIALPLWFKLVNGFGYAVGTENRQTGITSSVYGAGMSLRKEVYISLFGKNDFALTDRKADSLSSGGDTEICLLMREAGYQIYFDETLLFQHFINKERLNWSYYLRLRKSFGKANAMLQQQYDLKNRGAITNYISVAKFAGRNIKYLLFPFWYKNEQCANVVQEWSRQLNLFILNKKRFF